MIISGIDRQFIGVPDLVKARDFYGGMIGMHVVAEGPIDSAILSTLWELPGDVRGYSICMRNEKQPTALELVQLSPVPTESARDGAESFDYGLYDVAYIISDSEKVQQKLTTWGTTFFTEPYHYPPWPDGQDIIEGIVFGPGREPIALIQLIDPEVPESMRLDGLFWTMFDMAQMVENMDEAFSFYRDALGLTFISDTTLSPGFVDTVLHLPEATEARLVLFNHPESTGPFVQPFKLSVKGRTLDISPKKLGVFMISFETDNLEQDLDNVRQKHFKVITGPVQVETSLHGKVVAADIEGPNKIRVELFQKL